MFWLRGENMKVPLFFRPFGARSSAIGPPRLAPWAGISRRFAVSSGPWHVAVLIVLALTMTTTNATASVLGSVRGLIHDPQHRPVSGATVKLHAAGSAFEQTANSNDAGEFVFEK